jgi:hypothetical protein
MKLIDADKLLYDLANEDVPRQVHADVLDAIESGRYDADNNPAQEILPDHVMDLLRRDTKHTLHYAGRKYLVKTVIASIEKL